MPCNLVADTFAHSSGRAVGVRICIRVFRVMRGISAITGEAKAIKILSSDLILADPGASKRLGAEIHINQQLQSPYHDANAFSAGKQYVTCFDVMVNDPQLKTVMIVMPLVSNGELFSYIQNQQVSPHLLATWVHQLCFGAPTLFPSLVMLTSC